MAPLAAGIAAVLSLGGAPLSAASSESDLVAPEQGRSTAAVRDYWTPERMREAIPLAGPEQAAALVNGDEVASFRAAPTDQETFPGSDTLYPQRVHGKLFLAYRRPGRELLGHSGHSLRPGRDHDRGPLPGQSRASAGSDHVLDQRRVRAGLPGRRRPVRDVPRHPPVHHRARHLGFRGGHLLRRGGRSSRAEAAGVSATALGTRGVSFNRPSLNGQVFGIYGYPGQPAEFYNGQRLIHCSSPFLGFEQYTGGIKAGPCRQQEGSSGGGWVIGNGLVNSVVSHGGCLCRAPLCTTTAGTFLGDLPFEAYAKAAGGVPGKLRKRIKNCVKKNKKFKKEQRCLNKAETFQPVGRLSYSRGLGRGGFVGQDHGVTAGLDAPGGNRRVAGEQLGERLPLLLAGDDPQQAAHPSQLGIGEGHPAGALVLALGDRDPPVGDLEYRVSGDERGCVAVRAQTEVDEVEGVRE